MAGLEDDFTLLKSLIAIVKGGLEVSKLLREYREETGSSLNYSKYGFRDAVSMLSSCPNITMTKTDGDYKCQVNDEKISHITSLVDRTKTRVSQKRRPRGGQKNYFTRASFCTSTRNLYSPQRDSKYKSGGSTSTFKTAHVRPLQYQQSSNPNRSSLQRQYACRNNVPSNTKAQTSSISLHKGHQPIRNNQNLNKPIVHNRQHLKERDLKPVFCQTVSSSRTEQTSSSKSIKRENDVRPSSGALKNSTESVSKLKLSPKKVSTDSDWSSDLDEEPASTVSASVKAQSLQSSNVSSSSKWKANKSSFERNTCSFGARDVRYLSKTNVSNIDQQNLKSTPSVPLHSVSHVVREVDHANHKSVICVVKPDFKTFPQAKEKIQRSAVSNQEIAVGQTPNKRETSTTVKHGAQTILVKVPNAVALSSCEPVYGDFQFVGDSFLLRVAEVCLGSTIRTKGSISYCGLCRNNLTIAECEDEILKHGTTGKIVLMLGMTDIVQGASLEDMKRQTTSLLKTLQYNTVLVITLPVPPSFIMMVNEEKLKVLELYNRWLLNLHLPRLIDIDRHLYSDAPFYQRFPNTRVETFSEGGAWIVMDEIIASLG